MLMHEWIRYRNRQVKPATDGPGEATSTEDALTAEQTPADQPASDEPVESGGDLAAEEVEAGTPTPKRSARATQADARSADSTGRDRESASAALHEELDRAEQSVRDRVRQLQARQKQLPIEVAETEEDTDEDRPRRPNETRQELVQRLLDPMLTLREAALLLDVCPTTVRRYTNRGLLSCFRTPGNQRRFHLSEVLEFMERHERGEV